MGVGVAGKRRLVRWLLESGAPADGCGEKGLSVARYGLERPKASSVETEWVVMDGIKEGHRTPWRTEGDRSMNRCGPDLVE